MSDQHPDADIPGTGPSGMSRRAILSGMGAVGVTGALGGWATYAALADRELTGGFVQTGTVDLEVCWEGGEEDCDPSDAADTNVASLPVAVDDPGDGGTATIRAQIAETETATANPGTLWLRTSCPVDGCGLESAVDVVLWYDENCDGVRDDDEQVIERGSLGDVLRWLHDGVQIDGDRSDDPAAEGFKPVQPGQTVCLGFEWTLRNPLCAPDELLVEFEFRAEQARHSTAPESPWAGLACSVPDENCVACLDLAGISFVAFCGEALTDGDVTTTTTAVNLEGEVAGLDWVSTTRVDRVAVKLGNGRGDGSGSSGGTAFAMYEFDTIIQTTDGGSSGSILSPLGDDVVSTEGQLVVAGEPWNPCPDAGGLKYEFDEERWERV